MKTVLLTPIIALLSFITVLLTPILFISYAGLVFYEDHFTDDSIKYEVVHSYTRVGFDGKEFTITAQECNKTKLYIAIDRYLELLLFSEEVVEIHRIKDMD